MVASSSTAAWQLAFQSQEDIVQFFREQSEAKKDFSLLLQLPMSADQESKLVNQLKEPAEDKGFIQRMSMFLIVYFLQVR